MGIINFYKTILTQMTVSRHLERGDHCMSVSGPRADVTASCDSAPAHIRDHIEHGPCPSNFDNCQSMTHNGLTWTRCTENGADNFEVIEPETFWSGDVANVEPVSHNNGTYCIQMQGAAVTVAKNREMFRKRVADPHNWTVR